MLMLFLSVSCIIFLYAFWVSGTLSDYAYSFINLFPSSSHTQISRTKQCLHLCCWWICCGHVVMHTLTNVRRMLCIHLMHWLKKEWVERTHRYTHMCMRWQRSYSFRNIRNDGFFFESICAVYGLMNLISFYKCSIDLMLPSLLLPLLLLLMLFGSFCDFCFGCMLSGALNMCWFCVKC